MAVSIKFAHDEASGIADQGDSLGWLTLSRCTAPKNKRKETPAPCSERARIECGNQKLIGLNAPESKYQRRNQRWNLEWESAGGTFIATLKDWWWLWRRSANESSRRNRGPNEVTEDDCHLRRPTYDFRYNQRPGLTQPALNLRTSS